MCGIAGTWGALDADRLDRITDAVTHRGPDGRGTWVDREYGVMLGHRRLSIIDLAGGQQPMTLPAEGLALTFNGEIYNYIELREHIAASGRTLETNSDTETILHLYAMYGPDCVRRLRGMFAFALWDGRERQLVLARDRLGKKPLYYASSGGELLFASEINALVGADPNLRCIDDQALFDYLAWGMVLPPRTIYSNVRAVAPATTMIFREREVWRESVFWDLAFSPKRDITFNEAVDEVDRLLRESVKLRLRSDVPVGCFLSGGIDSGLLAAIASEHVSGPLTTVCIGSSYESHDERPHARLVAARYGTSHHEEVAELNASDGVHHMARAFGQPFANTSSIPNFLAAEAMKRHVKVTLSGDGGDEVLCGYRRHGAARAQALLRPIESRLTRSVVGRLLSLAPTPKVKRSGYELALRLARGWTLNPAERYAEWSVAMMNVDDIATMGGAKWSSTLEPPLRMAEELLAKYEHEGAVDQMLGCDRSIILAENLVLKMDITTMAYGLEARCPFLDHELVDEIARWPESIKLRGRQTKPLSRALAQRYLPDEVVNAKKRGFEVPFDSWLDNDIVGLRDQVLMAPTGILADRFDRAEIERLVRNELPLAQRKRANYMTALFFLGLWDQVGRDFPSSAR